MSTCNCSCSVTLAAVAPATNTLHIADIIRIWLHLGNMVTPPDAPQAPAVMPARPNNQLRCSTKSMFKSTLVSCENQSETNMTEKTGQLQNKVPLQFEFTTRTKQSERDNETSSFACSHLKIGFGAAIGPVASAGALLTGSITQTRRPVSARVSAAGIQGVNIQCYSLRVALLKYSTVLARSGATAVE